MAKNIIFGVLFIVSWFLSPAISLFIGIAYAMILGNTHPKLSKTLSKYMLQVSVVGLGFGMNLHAALASGRDGMLFTIVSVTGVLLIGYFIGRRLKISPRLTHLISSGTAICGGSAIAAVAPVAGADDNETSVSLAVIFTLNAIALFIFPPIGHLLDMTQQQFGLWAAIAIHDTSSVVGAGAEYGTEALLVATTVKLTRALWIIPLAIATMFIFKNKKGRIAIPWFIFLFIGAMILNTYITIPEKLSYGINIASHKMLSATLFLIGSTLSLTAIKQVGTRPILLGVILWIIISIVSLAVILA